MRKKNTTDANVSSQSKTSETANANPFRKLIKNKKRTPEVSPAKASVAKTVPVSPPPKPVPAASAAQSPAAAPERKAPEKKAPIPRVTTIVATIDVGWGNQVFLRGEGGGLSWDYGVPMTCRNNNEWVWVSAVNEPSFAFKFVLNDIFWEQSENRLATGGEIFSAIPRF
jgi:hypothetical protein